MQKRVFLEGEGDQWFERNASAIEVDRQEQEQRDLILAAIKSLNIQPAKALEIGCADGWRLELLRRYCDAQCYGIDPSAKAVAKGNSEYSAVHLQQGTADSLAFDNGQFDLVMIGFCLYLCDREDLFKIASEVDRVLREEGFVVLLDFHSEIPYRNSYAHAPGLYSYKMDYSRMFTWNPSYASVLQQVVHHSEHGVTTSADDKVAVTVLQKLPMAAFPDNPYRGA